MPDDATPEPAPSFDDDADKNPPPTKDNITRLPAPKEPLPEPEMDEADATGETDANEGDGQESDGDGLKGEGDASDGEGDGEEDEFDDETPDTLDKAAARIRHDYERRTLPYPEPVDGAELLNELVAAFDCYMVLPPGGSETLALWVVLTFCLYPCGMRFAPRLIVRKPVSNSGGTNLTILLLHLIRRPKYNSGMTDASFYRQANRRLTGIIDECDNPPLRSNYKLVRMINAGHGSTGTEPRTEHVGGKRVTVYYPIFGPVCLCGIGDFAPVTVRNRSFVISLKRKMVGEDVDEFNPTDHAPMMRTPREKIIRRVEDNLEAIRDCRPDLDRNLYQNRQRENIMTLLQIADVVGGGWGERAREALTNVTARDKPIDENELLIGDIAEILLDTEIVVGGDPNDSTKNPGKPIGSDNAVFSCDLWTLLRERFPHRLLYETNFTQAKMASMLSTFEIEPQRVGKRRGKHVLRWYLRSDFDDAIARYAPEIAAALLQTEEVPRSSVADNPEPQGVLTAATEPPALEAVMAAPVAEGSTSSAGAAPLQAAPPGACGACYSTGRGR